MSTDTYQPTEHYNGWTNYETFCVYSWLSCEEGVNGHCEVIANVSTLDQTVNRLREIVADYTVGTPAGLPRDLFDSALDRVDWEEVARAFGPCI